MTDFPTGTQYHLGDATILIQDHADSESPPPLRSFTAPILAILPNPDGTYTMPDGSVFTPPSD